MPTNDLWLTAEQRIQANIQKSIEKMRIEQQKLADIKAKQKAEQEALEASERAFKKFNEAQLEQGFLNGGIDPRVMSNVLEQSQDVVLDMAKYTTRALSDELTGVMRTPEGWHFNNKKYTSLRDLELAVGEFLGVSQVPYFNELLRGVLKGSPLTESDIRRLENSGNRLTYDAADLTVNDALSVYAIENY